MTSFGRFGIFNSIFLRAFFEHLLQISDVFVKPWTVVFDTYYVPQDILTAAIFVPGKYVIVLHALSIDMLEGVMQNGESLLGMKYPKAADGHSVYNRYDDAITANRKYCFTKARDYVKINYDDGRLTIEATGISIEMPGKETRYLKLPYIESLENGQDTSNPCKRLVISGEDLTNGSGIHHLIESITTGSNIGGSAEIKKLNDLIEIYGKSFDLT